MISKRDPSELQWSWSIALPSTDRVMVYVSKIYQIEKLDLGVQVQSDSQRSTLWSRFEVFVWFKEHIKQDKLSALKCNHMHHHTLCFNINNCQVTGHPTDGQNFATGIETESWDIVVQLFDRCMKRGFALNKLSTNTKANEVASTSEYTQTSDDELASSLNATAIIECLECHSINLTLLDVELCSSWLSKKSDIVLIVNCSSYTKFSLIFTLFQYLPTVAMVASHFKKFIVVSLTI